MKNKTFIIVLGGLLAFLTLIFTACTEEKSVDEESRAQANPEMFHDDSMEDVEDENIPEEEESFHYEAPDMDSEIEDVEPDESDKKDKELT